MMYYSTLRQVRKAGEFLKFYCTDNKKTIYMLAGTIYLPVIAGSIYTTIELIYPLTGPVLNSNFVYENKYKIVVWHSVKILQSYRRFWLNSAVVFTTALFLAPCILISYRVHMAIKNNKTGSYIYSHRF